MTVKIVTDSSSELLPEMARDLGITVVPIYVRFGEEVYKERVTISDQKFYQKLMEGTVPATIQPGPDDFVKVYGKIAGEADGIISIHISSKLSGTLNSALQAKSMVNTTCPIEVLDSQTVSVALGLITIAIAEAAREGKNLQQVLEVAKEAIDDTHTIALSAKQAVLGTMLNVKPLISVNNGEVVPCGRVRNRAKGMEYLLDFVNKARSLSE